MVVWYEEKKGLNQSGGFMIDTGINHIQFKVNKNAYMLSFSQNKSDVFLKKLDSVQDKLYKAKNDEEKLNERDKIYKFLIQYPDDYFGLMNFNIFANSVDTYKYTEQALAYFQNYSDRLKKTTLGKEIEARLSARIAGDKATKIGNPVPVFRIKTFEGKDFSNQDLQGQPYILAFSATWCAPCQAFQPTLLKLYHQYQAQGLKVIYFNLDDKMDIWKEHIEAKKLDWINVSERCKWKDSKITKQFNTNAIPRYFIIDKSGKIIYDSDAMDHDFTKLESYIQQAVK